jgi:hypothetical protein
MVLCITAVQRYSLSYWWEDNKPYGEVGRSHRVMNHMGQQIELCIPT